MEDYKKKYEEIIENIKEAKERMGGYTFSSVVDKIIPELKENEDEKLRKECISIIDAWDKSCRLQGDYCEVAPKCIAWLEKQGEQKPTDKVEPKFKVGDWIVKYGNVNTINQVIKVEQIDDEYFGYTLDDKSYFGGSWESSYRLWTIQDAKPGDVLHCWIDGDEFVLIYKGIKDGYITTYGHLYQNLKSFSEEPTTMFCRTIQGYFTPATKEQRDLLFQKMKEAEYEWDAENKELRKIEQNPVDNQFTPEQANVLDKHIDKFLEQKPAWSEEDEEMVECLNNCLDELEEVNGWWYIYVNNKDVKLNKVRNWLKSLKEKMKPQPKQEWSDEDYNEIETIACHLDNIDNEGIADVLRSIRDKYCHIIPQSTWKPSDEQMKFLWKYAEQNNYDGGVLTSLFRDLKKLREE